MRTNYVCLYIFDFNVFFMRSVTICPKGSNRRKYKSENILESTCCWFDTSLCIFSVYLSSHVVFSELPFLRFEPITFV